MGDVNRSVVLTLKIVADPNNAKAAASVAKDAADASKKQVDASQKAADAAKRTAALAAREAEKRYDKEAADAVKAYAKIMRERDRQSTANTKQLERDTAASAKAYDQQAKDALAAYSRIMRSREANTKAFKLATEQAEEHLRASARTAAASMNAIVGITEGFAKLGIMSEETTEAMLRDLIAIQGGFQVVREIINGYNDLKDSYLMAERALKAQAAAQEILNHATMQGVAAQHAHAAAAGARGVGAGGGAAAVGGHAAAAGGGGLMGLMGGGIAIAKTAALVGVLGLAVNELGSAIARGVGMTGAATESFTGALFSLYKTMQDVERSANKVADAESILGQRRKAVEEINERADKKQARIEQGVGFRQTLSGLRLGEEVGRSQGVKKAELLRHEFNETLKLEVQQNRLGIKGSGRTTADIQADLKATGDELNAAKGPKFDRRALDDQKRETEAARKRLAAAEAAHADRLKAPMGNKTVETPLKRTVLGWMGGQEAQHADESRTYWGYLKGQRTGAENEEARRSKNMGGLGPLNATGGVENEQKNVQEGQQKTVELAKQRLEAARATRDTERETVAAMRSQVVEAKMAVLEAKKRYQSEAARVGALMPHELQMANEIAKKLQAGQKIERFERDFAEQHGLFGSQIDAQNAKEGVSTEEGRNVLGLTTSTAKMDESVQTAAEGSEGVRDADQLRLNAENELTIAENALANTTAELNDALKEFRAGLAQLPKDMQAILNMRGRNEAPGGEADAEQVGAVGEAGGKVASNVERLGDTMVAALDGVDAKIEAVVDRLAARQARGNLIQQANV